MAEHDERRLSANRRMRDALERAERERRLLTEELPELNVVLAPAIRHERGEVTTEPRVVERGGRVVGITKGDVTSVLRRYHAHKEITDRQFNAGMRLQDDWERSQWQPAQIASYDRDVGGTPDYHARARALVYHLEEARAARKRFERAIMILPGPLRSAVILTVIRDLSASVWALQNGWPKAHGLPVLKIGLECLADYYGLTS